MGSDCFYCVVFVTLDTVTRSALLSPLGVQYEYPAASLVINQMDFVKILLLTEPVTPVSHGVARSGVNILYNLFTLNAVPSTLECEQTKHGREENV